MHTRSLNRLISTTLLVLLLLGMAMPAAAHVGPSAASAAIAAAPAATCVDCLAIRNPDASHRPDGSLYPGFYDDLLTIHYIEHRNYPGDKISTHTQARLDLNNTSASETLQISSITFSNPEFSLVGSAPTTIAPGASAQITVKFVYNSGAPTKIEAQLHSGSMTIVSNDSARPNLQVELRGLYQYQLEGNVEPTLQDIAAAFGATSYLDEPLDEKRLIKDANGNIIQTLDPYLDGDEVRSKTWRKAVENSPIYVRQIASFHGCCKTEEDYFRLTRTNGSNLGDFRHNVKYGQTILPAIQDQSGPAQKLYATPNSNIDMNTTFNIVAAGLNSDWTKNGSRQNVGLRVWNLRDRNGNVLPYTYLVGQDFVGGSYCDYGSTNCDFQDNVYIVDNVKPVDASAQAVDASAPGQIPLPDGPDSSSSLILEFDRAYAGTLTDINGATIGFTNVQPNHYDVTPGSASYQPSKISIDTSGTGRLTLQTSEGLNRGRFSYTNYTDNLENALQLSFDATSEPFTVSTVLVGPLNNLYGGQRQAGTFLGSDQDNFAAVVASANGSTPIIQFYVEQDGVGQIVGETPLPTPATLQTLELVVLGRADTGVLRAGYRVNGGALTILPQTLIPNTTAYGRFFDVRSRAGIYASHKNSVTTNFVFERFAVRPGDPSVIAPNPAVYYRLDTGTDNNYTDSNGNLWTSDKNTPNVGFTPPGTINEAGPGNNTNNILNTVDDPIYRTYRGQVAAQPKTLAYTLPLPAGVTRVDLRLHFAERFWSQMDKRRFDIIAEGQVLRPYFDIFAAAGGKDAAVVLRFRDLAVADGVLNLAFRTQTDNSSIAGIEVLQSLPDLEPPLSGLSLTTSSPTSLNAPTTFVATVTGGTPTSYTWDFGDGSAPLVTTANTVQHTYGAIGTYTVSVTASNSNNSLTKTGTVQVIQFGVKVNFQTTGATVPTGYVRDSGEVYAVRNGANQGGGAFSYGWDVNMNSNTRLRTVTPTPDQRLNTLIQMQSGGLVGTWNLAVDPGQYKITVAAGDPEHTDSAHRINIEGTPVINKTFAAGNFFSATVTLPVQDGKLTVDPLGGQNTKIDYIDVLRVGDIAIGGLSATANDPTELGQTTTLTATTTAGSNVTYVWNFGDGSPTATGAVVDHTYPAIGTYIATVTATNTQGSVSATTMIDIVDVPITGLAADATTPTGLDDPTTFNATVTAGSNVVYTWNFGDGTAPVTTTSGTIQHTYATIGNYTATVTASNGNTAPAPSVQVAVTVKDQPISGLTLDADDPTDLGDLTTFTALTTAGTGITYTWNFGDGTSPVTTSISTISHEYAEIGTYTAIVTASNPVSQDTATTQVEIQDVPISTVSVSSNTPTVVNTAAELFVAANGTNITSYQWNFGDGSVETTTTPATTHVYTAIGDYTVTVTATNSVTPGGKSGSTTHKVVAAEQPITGLTVASSTPTDLGETTVFTATTTAGTNLVYTWDFGDGTVQTDGPNIVHEYTAAGTYTVTVTATNSLGSMSATTKTVVVDPANLPIEGLSLSSNSPRNVGEVVTLTATTTAGTGISYTWDFGDGSPTETTSTPSTTHKYAAPGTYTATVTASNAAGTATATTQVVINNVDGKSYLFLPLILNNSSSGN